MEGCGCGNGARLMTPLDYLTLCVRQRFQAHRGLGGFNRQENIDSTTYQQTDLVDQWQRKNLAYPIGNHREPILCRYKYPDGENLHPEFEGQVMRTGFYQLKFKSPYTKADFDNNERLQLQSVFEKIDEGVDFESELFFAHWHSTLAECPCDDIPKYADAWRGDGEGTDETRHAATVRNENNTLTLNLGHTSNDEERPHLRSFSPAEWGIDLEKPTLLMESTRNSQTDVIYEQLTVFGEPTHRQSIAYGRRFLLLIPNSQIKKVQDFLPPQDDEIRAWGKDARFRFVQNDQKIWIIYGSYNSMAARVFNDIHQEYGNYARPFELGNKLNLHVIDAENEDIEQELGNNSRIKLSSNTVKILITKTRGGRLQPLLVYRVRVHGPVEEVISLSSVTLEEQTLESGGFELVIHAENKLAVSLQFIGLPEGVTTVDIQELKSTNLERELSHCSLHLEV